MRPHLPSLGPSVNTVFMYSKRPQRRTKKKSKEFEDLDDQQASFLRWIGTLIPALLRSVARGNVSARWILGRRRLKDGRDVELVLVADAPEKGDAASMYSTHGGASSAADSSESHPPNDDTADASRENVTPRSRGRRKVV